MYPHGKTNRSQPPGTGEAAVPPSLKHTTSLGSVHSAGAAAQTFSSVLVVDDTQQSLTCHVQECNKQDLSKWSFKLSDVDMKDNAMPQDSAPGIRFKVHQHISRRPASFMACCFSSALGVQQFNGEPHPPSLRTSQSCEFVGKQPNIPSREPLHVHRKSGSVPGDTQSTALSPTPTYSSAQADISTTAPVACQTAVHTCSPPHKTLQPPLDSTANSTSLLITEIQSSADAALTAAWQKSLQSQSSSKDCAPAHCSKFHHAPSSYPTSTIIPPGIQLPLDRPITTVNHNSNACVPSKLPADVAPPSFPKQQQSSGQPTLRRVTEPSPPPPQPSSSQNPLSPIVTIATLDSIHTLDVEWNSRRSNSKRNQLVQSWLHTAAQEAAFPPAIPRALFSPPGLELLDLSGSDDEEMPRSVNLHPHNIKVSSGCGPGPAGTDSHERGIFPLAARISRGPSRKQAGIHSADGQASQGPQDQQQQEHQLQHQQQRLEHQNSSQDGAHSSGIAVLLPALNSTAYSTSSFASASLPTPSLQASATQQLQKGLFPSHPAMRAGMHAAKRNPQTVSAGQVNLGSITKPPLQPQTASTGRNPPAASAELQHVVSNLDVSGTRNHRNISRNLTNPLSLLQHKGSVKGASGSAQNLVVAPVSANQTLASGSSNWCPRVALAARGTISVTSEVTTSSSAAEHLPSIPARALAADSQTTALFRADMASKPVTDTYMPTGAHGLRTKTIAVASHCPDDIVTQQWSIEDFTLLAKLYEGNLSVVCQAVSKATGRHVAMKIYKRSRLHEMERFQLAREICLHIRVLHPSVVALYAAWKDTKYVYLTLEWAPCGNLFDHLVSQGGRMRERDAATNVVRPLFTALAFLHAQKFIHRDVKLENILMDTNGAIKLADFGLAIDQKYEQANTRLGTFGYFAPEVLDCPLKKSPFDFKDMSLRGYDNKVDIWSAGVVAFEVLTGRAPFSASSAAKIIEAIRYRLLDLPAELSADARDFLQKALTRDPAERASAEQLLQHPWLNTP